jgi:hypothetical protein
VSLDIGINFRGTAGYVTDGANETYCVGDIYPTTRGGVTFGWETNAPNIQDRNAGSDRRLAGMNYASLVTRNFRLDLPATGAYDIHAAFGDQASSQHTEWLIKDDTTQFAAITTFSSAADAFKDATDVDRPSEANWIANEAKLTQTFASTVLRLTSNNNAANVVIAHLRVVQVGGAAVHPYWQHASQQVIGDPGGV